MDVPHFACPHPSMDTCVAPTFPLLWLALLYIYKKKCFPSSGQSDVESFPLSLFLLVGQGGYCGPPCGQEQQPRDGRTQAPNNFLEQRRHQFSHLRERRSGKAVARALLPERSLGPLLAQLYPSTGEARPCFSWDDHLALPVKTTLPLMFAYLVGKVWCISVRAPGFCS